MRKTHTFLEKFSLKFVNRDTSKLIHPLHMAAKPPNRSHYFPWWWEWARVVEKQTKREDERKSLGMKQGETIERRWCCSSERREIKEWKKVFFIVYEDNIKIIDRWATVTVHICTVTVAILHKCTILHPLMWVFFWVKMCKMSNFFYFTRLYTCWCGCS